MKQKRNCWIRVEKQQIWFKPVALETQNLFKGGGHRRFRSRRPVKAARTRTFKETRSGGLEEDQGGLQGQI